MYDSVVFITAYKKATPTQADMIHQRPIYGSATLMNPGLALCIASL
jgi:hypothetical protein